MIIITETIDISMFLISLLCIGYKNGWVRVSVQIRKIAKHYICLVVSEQFNESVRMTPLTDIGRFDQLYLGKDTHITMANFFFCC